MLSPFTKNYLLCLNELFENITRALVVDLPEFPLGIFEIEGIEFFSEYLIIELFQPTNEVFFECIVIIGEIHFCA